MAASGSRTAKVELKTSAAGMDRGLNDAKRKLRSFQREEAAAARSKARAQAAADKKAARAAKDAQRRTIGLGHSVVAGLGAAAGFDLAGGISGMVSEIFEVEKELTRLGIDAGMSAQAMAAMRASLMATSEATGVSRLELAKTAHGYQILTGDAKGAASSIALFGEVAIAAGASSQDIAEAAASLRQNLHLDPKDFRKGFDVLLNLGHHGSMELRDMAGELSGVAPMFAKFGDGDGAEKLAEMGAAMEVIKPNFKGASEAADGFMQAMTQLSKTKVADRLAAHGVLVWRTDPKTKLHVKRDWFDIMADIQKHIPDEKVLTEILGGRQEALRAIGGMRDRYKEMVDLKNQAAGSDQVAVDSQRYLESSTGRIAVAWEHVKNSIANAFTPERIEAFAGAVEKTAKFLVDAVGLMDRLMNGPGKEEGAGDAAREFVEQANDGTDGGERKAVLQAKAVLAAKSGSMEEAIGIQRYGSLQNWQEGARLFLKSDGADLSSWADTGGDRGRLNAPAAAAAIGSGQLDARQIGIAIGKEIASYLKDNVGNRHHSAEPLKNWLYHPNAHVQATRSGGRR